MEERVLVQTILVNYRCPACHNGHLIQTGLVRFPNDTPSEDGINKVMYYEHKCDNPNCRYNEYLEKVYPHKEEQYKKLEHITIK